MNRMESELETKLGAFAHALIDQEKARVIVAPEKAERGYWFGGGNMAAGPDGALYLCGRFRSAGDSRTGLDLGDRGRELAIFASIDKGHSWKKLHSFPKAALLPKGMAGAAAATPLDRGPQGCGEVLSIEGAALRFLQRSVQLFVSSEKASPYPEGVREYMKPGTGVWTIELLAAPDLAGLASAVPRTILSTQDPRYLHIKDPFIVERPGCPLLLGFCHHPFTWASSSTGLVEIDDEGLPRKPPVFEALPRGPAWDVAITRVTSILPLSSSASFPRLGAGLVFYDGGECLRNLDEHAGAKRRPRGYSCEELGGLGYYAGDDLSSMERMSKLAPEFLSPYGTGSSRYVDVLSTEEGYYATWQQSRKDGSQALVMNFLPAAEAARILG